MGTITHRWDGTTLVITSDSGTSACNLKGSTGDVGVRGPQGKPGILTDNLGNPVLIDDYYNKAETDEKIQEALAGGGGGGGSGENGATFTPDVSEEGVLSWTNDKGLENPEPVNIKGETGTRGSYWTSGKGVPNDNDNSNILDLYIDTTTGNYYQKAYMGWMLQGNLRGSDGTNGKDGTSVTVASVSESTADSGSNIVTFSDGKTLTIKNGSKGSDGTNGKDGSNGADGVGISNIEQTNSIGNSVDIYTITLTDGSTYTFDVTNGTNGTNGKTPVKGTDYFTAADKTEMVNAVIASLTTEQWVFTLESGSTVTKEVVLK